MAMARHIVGRLAIKVYGIAHFIIFPFAKLGESDEPFCNPQEVFTTLQRLNYKIITMGAAYGEH